MRLAERQEARHDSRLDLYIDRPLPWSRASGADRLLGFHVLVSNPTDRQSSLIGAELHLTYSANGVMTTVKVPHAHAAEVERPADVSPIVLPARLDANDALSGWLLFSVPGRLTDGAPVDRYDVVVRDVHGIEELKQVTLIDRIRG